MSVLVVDDEERTVHVLRRLLADFGYKAVWAAKNAEDATQILKRKGSQIELIISDLEIPKGDGISLAQELDGDPRFEYTFFILASSDLPKSKLKRITEQSSRIDSSISKPFDMESLNQAISKAYIHRQSSRRKVLFITEEKDEFLEKALEVLFKKNKISWNELIYAKSSKEAFEILNKDKRSFGLILIDSFISQNMDLSWLKRLKKSPWGFAATVVCIGNDPFRIATVRLHAEVFVELNGRTRENWTKMLQKVSKRVHLKWDAKMAIQRTKYLIQNRDYRKAKKILEKTWKADFTQVQVGAFLANCYEKSQNHKKAFKLHLDLIKINPCAPSSYIKIFLNWKTGKKLGVRIASIIEDALKYCPEHPEISRLVEIISTQMIGDYRKKEK